MTTARDIRPEFAAAIVRDGRPRRALPPEVAATVLALSTVVLGAVFGVPTFGIFLGWAAAALASSGAAVRMPLLGRCLAMGALFGAGTILVQSALGQILGTAVPQWLCALAALAIANPLLILLGRTAAFSAVPGMFIGFSTVFAVSLSGGTPISGSILGALVVSVLTNLTGVAFHWLYGRMATRRSVKRDVIGHDAPAASPADASMSLN